MRASRHTRRHASDNDSRAITRKIESDVQIITKIVKILRIVTSRACYNGSNDLHLHTFQNPPLIDPPVLTIATSRAPTLRVYSQRGRRIYTSNNNKVSRFFITFAIANRRKL